MSIDAKPRDSHDDSSGGHGSLTLYIVGAIVAAIVLALAAPALAVKFHVGGEVFLRLLQMVVVPLVMASVMSGILGLGDVRKLGRPGGYAILYYLSTTVLAVATGLIVVNIINPGKSIDPQLVQKARRDGARQVDNVSSLGARAAQVTWQTGLFAQQFESGLSDVIEIPHQGAMQVIATVVQIEAAQAPAEVSVLWSAEEEGDYAEVGERRLTPRDPGTHKLVFELPENAHFVKVDYQAQVGPGKSAVAARVVRGPPEISDIAHNLVLMLFTNNLLESMVNIDLLPLIVFSIVFAGMLTTMGTQAEVISSFVVAINNALLRFILLLMRLAPLGIFCLVAARFGEAQLEGSFVELLKTQAKYMATVLSGLAIHGLFTLPLILWVFTRRNPLTFISQMSQAVLTAFSTASSTATLPVTMECAEMKAGVSKRSTEFVLPLGATINMDGTALYEAAAAIFIAQAYAVVDPTFQLGLLQQATIAITATLAAIGAAGIPEAGLVTMLIVLNAVGLPLELIGLILPVDWLLDRFRTAVNAFGDSVGAAVVDRSFDSNGA